jgi:hypothetical protein
MSGGLSVRGFLTATARTPSPTGLDLLYRNKEDAEDAEVRRGRTCGVTGDVAYRQSAVVLSGTA